MKTKTLGIGLVGTKFMGKAHSNAWMTAPRFFDLPMAVDMRAVAGVGRVSIPMANGTVLHG